MGIHGKSSNSKQCKPQRNLKKLARKNRREIIKKKPLKQGDVDPKDVGLFNKHHVKMRRSNPFANIRMSGKQRNRQLKKLRCLTREKQKMDVEDNEKNVEEKKSSKTRSDDDRRKAKNDDVEEMQS
ncbi:Uncharacterised protein g4366 [Pycnogonum litorale]